MKKNIFAVFLIAFTTTIWADNTQDDDWITLDTVLAAFDKNYWYSLELEIEGKGSSHLDMVIPMAKFQFHDNSDTYREVIVLFPSVEEQKNRILRKLRKEKMIGKVFEIRLPKDFLEGDFDSIHYSALGSIKLKS